MERYRDLLALTPRLAVRPLAWGDYVPWLAGYQGRGPSRSPYDEGWFDPSELTEEWFVRRLKDWAKWAAADRCYPLAIVSREDGRIFGECDITTHMREDFQYGRVGYAIHNQYWGHGYATEALKALLHIGFCQLDFHRLEAHINLGNHASQRVARKAGMTFECVRRGFILEHGRWTDHEVYAAIAGEKGTEP